MPDAATPRLTRTVAMLNQKGGVGKTTTTVNLAAAIARRGRPTLVVDLDPQAHATIHLGVEPSENDPTIYDVLLEPAQCRDAIVRTRENLAVLPAEVNLAAAETELADAPDRNARLRQALETLGDEFEFILFDCPPSLGLLTLNALSAAREVVVPMQSHFLALQGVGKLLETVKLVARNVNTDIRVSGVILCAHDDQTKHAKEVVADLEGFFEQSREHDVPWRGARVYRPAVRRHIKLAECPSFGQTIFEYAPGLAGAQDYEQLADAFLSEWDLMLERRRRRADDEPEIVIAPPRDPATA
jgi:chromosome partitioning protein